MYSTYIAACFFAYIYQSLCLVKYRQDYSSAIAVAVQLK